MNSKWEDYYEALEVEFGCTDEEIKKSYRALMKKYHPDSKDADEDKSKLINEAYAILGDAEKRAEYDSTYMQYKNGEFQEETESEEMPKYTHEEMNEAFTEEEIRFAKRVALQKAISETLENAKVIIDAKNELLFAAFNDAYDKETYREEYDQFCSITKEFISNLEDLVKEAQEYSLSEEIITLNQVINFLEEVMEEIPKTLKEAKRKVKIDLMKEQLKAEAEQVIANAENVREEFIGLYGKVYRENISKEEFKTYYDILHLGVTDALSQLVEIYDLLKKADLDDAFKDVGVLIGKLNEDLKLYKGQYKVAKVIGKRQDLKDKIKNSMLSYTEYKVKMLEIMQEVIDNPTLDNAKLRVEAGRALTKEFSSKFFKIKNEDFEDSLFADEAKSISKDAKTIYKKRAKLFEKLSKIFEKKETDKIGKDAIDLLVENVEMSEEEIEAIKLLRETYILLGQHTEYREITMKDIKKLIKEVNGYLKKSEELQRYLDLMYQYIEELAMAYQDYIEKGGTNGAVSSGDLSDLSSKIDLYRELSLTARLVANTLVIVCIFYAILFADEEPLRQFQLASESFSIPENVISALKITSSVFIPLRVFSSSFAVKASMLSDRLGIFEKTSFYEKRYEKLLNERDEYLNDIYEKARKI